MMIVYLNKLLVNFAFVNSVNKIIKITGLKRSFLTVNNFNCFVIKIKIQTVYLYLIGKWLRYLETYEYGGLKCRGFNFQTVGFNRFVCIC